jgi:hypothetical protein
LKQPPRGADFQEGDLSPAISLTVAAVSIATIGGAFRHLLSSDPNFSGWWNLSFLIVPLLSAWGMLWLLEKYAGQSRTWDIAVYIFIIVIVGPDLARHLLFGLGWDISKLISSLFLFTFIIYQISESVENPGRWANFYKGILQCIGGFSLFVIVNSDNYSNIFIIIIYFTLIMMIFWGLRNIRKHFVIK